MRRGFTVPEVIVALVIIGLLIGVLLPAVSRRINDSQLSALSTTLDNFRAAIQGYHTHVTKYPGRMFDLQVRPVGSLDACGNGLAPVNWNKWKGPYVSLSAVGSPDTVGVAAEDWVVSDTLVRIPATDITGTAPGRLELQIANMKLQDANRLNDLIDGPPASVPPQSGNTDTAGIIRWGTVTGNLTTVKYGIAIAGC